MTITVASWSSSKYLSTLFGVHLTIFKGRYSLQDYLFTAWNFLMVIRLHLLYKRGDYLFWKNGSSIFIKRWSHVIIKKLCYKGMAVYKCWPSTVHLAEASTAFRRGSIQDSFQATRQVFENHLTLLFSQKIEAPFIPQKGSIHFLQKWWIYMVMEDLLPLLYVRSNTYISETWYDTRSSLCSPKHVHAHMNPPFFAKYGDYIFHKEWKVRILRKRRSYMIMKMFSCLLYPGSFLRRHDKRYNINFSLYVTERFP